MEVVVVAPTAAEMSFVQKQRKAAPRIVIPGLCEPVEGCIGYASDEFYDRKPVSFNIASWIRKDAQASYVEVELQVLVEGGLVIPIRISRLVVEASILPEAVATKQVTRRVLSSFCDYVDRETSIQVNGQILEPLRPETEPHHVAERCVSTSVAVLGPEAGAASKGSRLLRQAALSVVDTGLAHRCLVEVRGEQVLVKTFGSGIVPEAEILQLLCNKFDFQGVCEEEMTFDIDIKDETEPLNIDPIISTFAKYVTKRFNHSLNLVRQIPYKKCDLQPILNALRRGWRFLRGCPEDGFYLSECPGIYEDRYHGCGTVFAHPVSPMRAVPDHILKPKSSSDEELDLDLQELSRQSIEIRAPEEVCSMRHACGIARAALDAAASTVRAGVTTDAIDEVVHTTIVHLGAYPSLLRFGGYTKSCYTSVNEVLSYGVPDARPLVSGDIVTVYVAAFVDGVHGAVSETIRVGEVDKVSEQLIQCSRECVEKIVAEVQPTERYRGVGGRAYSELGLIMTQHSATFGFQPSKWPIWAGIGKHLESAPQIPQWCRGGKLKGKLREWLQPGHTFFLEPLIISGNQGCVSWTSNALVARDGMRNASWGRTVLVTSSGLEVL